MKIYVYNENYNLKFVFYSNKTDLSFFFVKVDRREQLCRQLSESESSLEMDEERALNERIKAFPRHQKTSTSQQHLTRARTVSSPSSNNNLNSELAPSTSNDFQRPRPPSTSLDTNNQME